MSEGATAPRTGAHSSFAAHAAVVLAAVAFGTTFLPVQHAIRHAGPVPFLAVRFLIGALVVWPFARRRPMTPGVVVEGLRCGVPLLAGYLLQTYGLRYTTTSVSAFVTYTLVVMVPILGAITSRRLPAVTVMLGATVALGGLFLLTGAHVGLGLGVGLTLGCAFFFAVNIIAIDRAVARVDPLRLAMSQLAVVGLGALVPGFFLGGYAMPAASYGWAVYTAVLASALAFGLQVWGQRMVGPTRTSLLLMLEPVAAAALGYASGERLGAAGFVGAALILGGILLAEALPARAPVGALDRTVN